MQAKFAFIACDESDSGNTGSGHDDSLKAQPTAASGSSAPIGNVGKEKHPMTIGNVGSKEKRPVTFRPVTEMECRASAALSHCRIPSGTAAKRFVHNIARQIELRNEITDPQGMYLWQCVYRFRRQIGREIVERAILMCSAVGLMA